MLNAVRLGLDHLLYVVQGKELQHQGKVVGIQQQLCHILKLENVYTPES